MAQARRKRKSTGGKRMRRGGGGGKGEPKLNTSKSHLNSVMHRARHKARAARHRGDEYGTKLYMSAFSSAATDVFERPRTKRRGWARSF